MRSRFLGVALSALVGLAACGDDAATIIDARTNPIDAGGLDSPTDGAGADASCFTNPTTHVEIINGCTTAEKIYKQPELPLLNPDGTLPPIP